MHTPKLRPPMDASKIIKQGQPNDESPCVRIGLIVWACLRLVVSVLWTGIIILKTLEDYKLYGRRQSPSSLEDPFLVFGIIATNLQLVEFGMLVIFIIAGIKRSAKLYRAYLRYCILTLIIYIYAVLLCILLDYYDGHFFGEIYLTYHFTDFAPVFTENDELIFGIVASLDVCLEILLIYTIKKLINKYECNENYVTGENI